jgi:PhnB protein
MAEQPGGPVVPQLYVDSVEKAREFYIGKLGFAHMMGIVGKDGKLDFSIVTRDGAMMMFSRPLERLEGTAEKYPTRRPVELYIYVADVDAYHDEVKGKGVKISDALTTQWWGDRNFGVEDPYGYRVWFTQNIKDFRQVQPPAGVKVV